ncbi:MAG: site-specific integrase [Chloroflexota bacterium]|nr:site-specific integrase [Chloroflexota bacterium]PLS78844.1 MAG: integrase [Chloroflexota bacterium]
MKVLPEELFQNGQRKYLTPTERDSFLAAAQQAEREVRTFCCVLAFTGCRLSEAVELTADRVDLAGGVIVLESLKKRRRGIYRAVPVPPWLLDDLDLVHGIRKAQKAKNGGRGTKLWNWSDTTAWRRVKQVMQQARLTNPASATPKGLRHAFGVLAVSKGIPLNKVQQWLGHTDLKTTAIYADAQGEEEQIIASRMW